MAAGAGAPRQEGSIRAPALRFDTNVDGPVTRVRVSGVVNEDADFGALLGLRGKIELELSGIRRFNSFGVRLWIDAMREITQHAGVECVACSRAVVDQMNMIRGFIANATVVSFLAPFRCEPCAVDVDHLVRRADCLDDGRIPTAACPRCGRVMELDDLEDSYMLFIREATRP